MEKNLGEPAPADFDAVASVMIDPASVAGLDQNIASALQALGVLGQISTGVVSGGVGGIDGVRGGVSTATSKGGELELPDPDVEKSVLDKIGDAAIKFKGGMFDEGAIALQAILAEVAHLKKGQAYLMSQLSQQAMVALIDGAHTQAKLAKEKSQTEAFASFMNAGLAAVGAGINIAGTASAMKAATAGSLSSKQMTEVDDVGRKVTEEAAKHSTLGSNKAREMVGEQAGQQARLDKIAALTKENKELGMALIQSKTTMTSALASIFSQVGTGIVDGFKTQEVGRLEAERLVLDNAMQILSQMMSKWGDEERAMHDDVTKAAEAMKQAHEAMVTNINKLGA